MAKRSKRAEEVADRILAGLRPCIIKLVERELSQAPQAPTEHTELSERDLAEAEALVHRWGAKKGTRHA